MVGFHAHGAIPATISTNAKLSPAIEILGRNKIAFDLPTFVCGVITATANVFVQVSETSASTDFRRLVTMGVYSSNSGLQQWELPSTTGNVNVVVPLAGYAFCKIELSNTATANVTCNVHVME